MNINEMTRKEFEALPQLPESSYYDVPFGSLIILPGKANALHDSGFRCMAFVLVGEDGQPLGKIGGGSDVIHIDGIGGYGYKWLERYEGCPAEIPVSGWSVDCLAKSGLLRLFCAARRMTCSLPFSSFEVFAITRNSHLPDPIATADLDKTLGEGGTP